jgi:hypothetical protein
VGITVFALVIGPGDSFSQVLDNTTFDTDVSGWTPAADSTLAWDPLDARADPTSGSALVTNLSNTEVDSTGSYQCTDGILEASTYAISAEAYIPCGQTESGLANIVVFWYAEPGCSTLLDLAVSTNVLTTTPDLWLPVSGWLTAPAGSQSARIRLNVLKVEDTGSLVAHFDNVSFAEGVFTDGFESGDSSAWSDTVCPPGLISFISLQVTPGMVPPSGGNLSLLALVKDDVGQGVANAPVNFLTEAGTLGSGGALLYTDSHGQASDTLTVTQADIDALARRTFVVRAQTVDSATHAIEASFIVHIQTGAPIADFTFVATGLSVQFQNQSTGDQPLSYLWDFGDQTTPPNQTLASPTHVYNTAGTYNVRLTVTNAVGTDSVIQQVTVSQ